MSGHVSVKGLLSLDWCGGSREIVVSLDEAQRFALDPNGVISKAVGVPYAVYAAWLRADGRVICCAHTSKGRPCAGHVPGVRFNDSPLGWSKFPPGYCAAHDQRVAVQL